MSEGVSTDLPSYFQALLSIIGFLIASAFAWYAYYVKGKKEIQSATEVPWFDLKVFRKMGEDLTRLADVAEKSYTILKKNSEEAEIQRRVDDELRHRKEKHE